jgi:hypothetical protein
MLLYICHSAAPRQWSVTCDLILVIPMKNFPSY